NEALQVMSEMQKASVMSFDTMRKMFTGRNVTQIVGVLSQIDGDLGAYNKRMTESSDIVKVTEQASKTWVHELTTLKQTIGDVSTGMGSFMDAFAPFLGMINNGVQTVTRDTSAMKALNTAMSAITGGATLLTVALLATSKAFRATATASLKNGMMQINTLSGGLTGGIKNLFMSAGGIIAGAIGPVGLALAGITLAFGVASAACYSYIEAEKARMRALDQTIKAAKAQIVVNQDYGLILEKATRAAIGGMNASSGLAKNMDTLSESFTYALGGSKDATSAIVDFIDTIVKKAKALEALKSKTANTAVEWASEKNKDSKDYGKIGQTEKLAYLADLDEDKRNKMLLAQEKYNYYNDVPLNNNHSGVIQKQHEKGDITEEESQLLKEFLNTIEIVNAGVMRKFVESNGREMNRSEKSKYYYESGIGKNAEESNKNVEIFDLGYKAYKVSDENAKKEIAMQTAEAIKNLNETLEARVNSDNEERMKNGLTKVSDYTKRMDDPNNAKFVTPDMAKFRKFLKDVQAVDNEAFAKMDLEKANKMYKGWSNKVSQNIGIVTSNLNVLNTDGGLKAKDIVSNVLSDDVKRSMIENGYSSQLAEIESIAGNTDEDPTKIAAILEILTHQVDTATLALISSRIESMGATYTSETRKNIVKSRSEEKL
ncbi:MAG: hypothetical protein ACRC5T_00895, partial [Cetobacterium sp.]